MNNHRRNPIVQKFINKIIIVSNTIWIWFSDETIWKKSAPWQWEAEHLKLYMNCIFRKATLVKDRINYHRLLLLQYFSYSVHPPCTCGKSHMLHHLSHCLLLHLDLCAPICPICSLLYLLLRVKIFYSTVKSG